MNAFFQVPFLTRRQVKVYLKKNKNNEELCQSHITFMLQKYIEEEYKTKQDLSLFFEKRQFCLYFQIS